MPFLSGADLLVLRTLSEAFIILGLVGVVSMFFNERRNQRRWLGLLFTVMAAGGAFLTWRVDQLLVADRDLTSAQQAALSKAVSRFPNIKFLVQTVPDDGEAHSLAQKILDAIRAAGATPQFVDGRPGLPPGVILVFNPTDGDLRRDLAAAVGTQLAAARIAVVADEDVWQPQQGVRIVVGKKP